MATLAHTAVSTASGPVAKTDLWTALLSLPRLFANAQRVASEFEMLNALSDAQLAEMGLERSDISRRLLAKLDA